MDCLIGIKYRIDNATFPTMFKLKLLNQSLLLYFLVLNLLGRYYFAQFAKILGIYIFI